MVKVFELNENKKIEFTKDELESLLNEVWDNGYNSGYNHNPQFWWTSPTTTDRLTIKCGDGHIAQSY